MGRQLADAVADAVPGWVRACVARVLEAWVATGGQLRPEAGPSSAVLERAQHAGLRGAEVVRAQLRQLLSADVDGQWTTPLAVVRQAVRFPTEVLAEAGVPPLDRDRFTEGRFPDDPYGLTPASLRVLSPELAESAVAWGAAKAAAHRARHRVGP